MKKKKIDVYPVDEFEGIDRLTIVVGITFGILTCFSLNDVFFLWQAVQGEYWVIACMAIITGLIGWIVGKIWARYLSHRLRAWIGLLLTIDALILLCAPVGLMVLAAFTIGFGACFGILYSRELGRIPRRAPKGMWRIIGVNHGRSEWLVGDVKSQAQVQEVLQAVFAADKGRGWSKAFAFNEAGVCVQGSANSYFVPSN